MTIAWRLEHEEVVDEVEALGLLIRETDAGLIAFGVIQGVAEREAAVRALKERLTLPFKEFTLSSGEKDPVKLFLTVPKDERVCVSFYDLENALPDAAGFLNLQRERFAELPHAVIFWVGQHGLRELATDAPDFWAWRSGVFDFRSEQFERPAAAMRETLGEGYEFQDRGDLERKISLYQGLMDEQGRQESPNEAFVARLRSKMSRAFLVLGRLTEAEDQASQALEIYRRLGDRAGEASALDSLGAAWADLGRLEEAEKSFRDSLEIEEGIGDESRLARSYLRQGLIPSQRGCLDEAEERYRKSLEISERLGLERAAAFGYHQMGIIARERGRPDEAEEWYRKSLEIWERLGVEWYAAIDYHQIGTVSHALLRLDEAAEWYSKSLAIFERLGLQREIVNNLVNMGLLRRQQRRREAVVLFGRALAIVAEHNMEVEWRVRLELAEVAQVIGDEAFESAWREAFEDQEPPIVDFWELAEEMKPQQTTTPPEPSP